MYSNRKVTVLMVSAILLAAAKGQTFSGYSGGTTVLDPHGAEEGASTFTTASASGSGSGSTRIVTFSSSSSSSTGTSGPRNATGFVSVNVGPGARVVKRTTTFSYTSTGNSSNGVPAAAKPASRPLLGFGNDEASPAAPWDPLSFFSSTFGFDFPAAAVPSQSADGDIAPKETESIEQSVESVAQSQAIAQVVGTVSVNSTVESSHSDADDECSDLETSQAAVERCINAVRQNPARYAELFGCTVPEYEPRPALKVAATLTQSASIHAADMAKNRFVSHTGSDRSTMGERIWERAAFIGSPIAENVAGGQQSARSVVFAWMCSAGHRKNIMSCSYDSMGTGVVGTGRLYWVQNFGCSTSNRCTC